MQDDQEKQKIELTIQLLKQIHFYYPIGMPHLRASYEGFLQLKRITANKIDRLINGEESAWTKLIYLMEEKFSDKVFDMAYWQFPCYQLRVEMYKASNNLVEHVKSLTVNLSLLCKYYTAYFEDSYSYNASTLPLKFRVIYGNQIDDKATVSINLDEIKMMVESCFDNYAYVDHRILFNYKIAGGFPGMESLDDMLNIEYPMYSFLFDGLMTYEHLQVVE